jgi:hypothetical protein
MATGGLKAQRKILPSVDSGTNAPVVTLNQSQTIATPPGASPYVHPVEFDSTLGGAAIGVPTATARALRQNANRQFVAPDTAFIPIVETPPNAPRNSLIWANSPDNTILPSPTQVEALTNVAGQPGQYVQPRTNILDQFASYTYNLGWYMLTPSQFTELSVSATSRIDVSQWSLLVQSGGADKQVQSVTYLGTDPVPNNNVRVAANFFATPNRNRYFTLDYYLDDLVIKSTVTNANASQFSNISFKVTEPNGITLVPNLNYAAREVGNGALPLSTDYCMVIKFYGWDINGNLITDPTQNLGIPGVTPTISNAILTRYYPFTINKINFKVESKSVIYEIEAAPKPYAKASSTSLGSIPTNLELSGETVGQLLSGSGNILRSAISKIKAALDGRDATNVPTPNVVTGPIVVGNGASVNTSARTNLGLSQ